MKSLEKSFNSKSYIIDPTHYLSKMWEITMFSFLFLQIIIIPFNAAFGFNFEQTFFGTISYFIFIFNIVVNVNISYYEDAKFYTKRKQILYHYIENEGVIDILNLTFTFLYFEDTAYKIVLFTTRMIKLYRSNKKLQ